MINYKFIVIICNTLCYIIHGILIISPSTISTLNVSNYLGRWYQMYTSDVLSNNVINNDLCPITEYYKLTKTSDDMFQFEFINTYV